MRYLVRVHPWSPRWRPWKRHYVLYVRSFTGEARGCTQSRRDTEDAIMSVLDYISCMFNEELEVWDLEFDWSACRVR